MKRLHQIGPFTGSQHLVTDYLGESWLAEWTDTPGRGPVLLRVFTMPDLSEGQLWPAVLHRRLLKDALNGPNLAEGVHMGEDSNGNTFVAYRHRPGRSLADLLGACEAKQRRVSLSEGLLLAGEIAHGVATAFRERAGAKPILHGFLIPLLVWVGDQGGVEVQGYQVVTGLRPLARLARREVVHYVSSEARQQRAIDERDDVFSLGAILFELTTGRPLPLAGGSYARMIKQVRSAKGAALPADLSSLLVRSLGPREERIVDAAEWHATLSELASMPPASEARQCITRLVSEVAEPAPKSSASRPKPVAPSKELPSTEPAATATVSVPTDPPRFNESVPVQSGPSEAPPDLQRSGSRRPLLVGGLVGLLALGVCGAALVFFRDAAPPAAVSTTPSVSRSPDVASLPVLPPDVEPTLDRLDQLAPDPVDQESEDLPATEESERVLPPPVLPTAENPPVSSPPLPTPRPTPPPVISSTGTTDQPPVQVQAPRRPVRAESNPERVAVAPPPPSRQQPPTAPPPVAAAPPARPVAQVPQDQPSQGVSPPPPLNRAAPGDVVISGPGVTPPRLSWAPKPKLPTVARVRAGQDLEVLVLVNARGSVDVAVVQNEENLPAGLAPRLVDAARQATFEPATKDGNPVAMWASISF